MHPIRIVTIHTILAVAALSSTAGLAYAADSVHVADLNEGTLIELLQSDAPPQEKAITCKRLAVCGTKNAVPALASLLTDPELASWSRIALEVIPDRSAGQALIDAMDKVQGRRLVGVINSIAVRRDLRAVQPLVDRLRDRDADVAAAAAVALGQLNFSITRADDRSTRALEQSLATTSDAVRSAVAQGCLLSAHTLLEGGKAEAAAKLFDLVHQSDVPQHQILEATRGAILARGPSAVGQLVELLQSDDRGVFAVGLQTAVDMADPCVTEALVGMLANASSTRQKRLLHVLAAKGQAGGDDPAILPAILQSVRGGSAEVRAEAIGLLEKVGDVSCLSLLLEAAVGAEEEVAAMAKEALVGLPGAAVDTDLISRLAADTLVESVRSGGSEKRRLLLLELVGLRRIDAVDVLLDATEDPDRQIRAAALTALGTTVGAGDLEILIQHAVAPKHAGDAEVALQALRAAAVRMPDREASAGQLVNTMSTASTTTQCGLLEILGAMGGKTALLAVADAAREKDPALRDMATRLLGQWMTVDAGPVLLELAKSGADDKYTIRAMRGYIRVARQFNMPAEERVAMCRGALEHANRDAEKKLVLVVAERYPGPRMLELAIELAKYPALKENAARVSLAIVQKTGGDLEQVQKRLAQFGIEPLRLEILQAEYGAGDQFKDVTQLLQQYAGSLPTIVLPSASYNSSFGGDPVPGIRKVLKVRYSIDGKQGQVSLPENAKIVLPVPE